MKNMQMIKKNKGITLIALIITIIILLILAGITIEQINNNGLFKNTKIASEKYKNKSDEEKEVLSNYINSVNNIANTREETEKNFIGIIYRHVNGKNGYTIYSDGWIEQWGENQNSIVTLPIKMKDTNYIITGIADSERNNAYPAVWGGISVVAKDNNSIYVSYQPSYSSQTSRIFWKIEGYADKEEVNAILAHDNIKYRIN